MAAVPVSGRSLFGKISAAAAARKVRSGRPGRPGKLAAAAAVARQHVVTVAALSSVDVGVFRASVVAGWIVTGACLLVLDFAVRG